MTLVAYLDGGDEAHRIKIGDMGLSSRADGGGAFSQIIFDDPDGTLNVRGFMTVRVEETECTDAPILHWGWIWTRSYKRGPYKHAPGRIIDCQVLDPNRAMSHVLITGLDGKRPAETDIERIDWLLNSAYVPLVQDFGLVNRASPHPMEEADYVGQYAANVLEDLCGQFWKTWFVYVDQAAEGLGLFYDIPTATTNTSTLTVSNVMSDESDTCYYPFLDAELERDPSEVASVMRFKYRNGVVLGHNSDTYDTFFADSGLGQHGVQVESTRVGQESTARDRIQTLLGRLSDEHDTQTFMIEIEPENVGLLAAGQRLGVRWTHLANEGYDPQTFTRLTARTIRQVRADLYRIECEASMAGVTTGAGGGGGDTGGFPHPPGQTPSVVQYKSASNGNVTLDDPVTDGHLLLLGGIDRTGNPPVTPTGFTILPGSDFTDGNPPYGGNPTIEGRAFYRVASSESGNYVTGGQQIFVMELDATSVAQIAAVQTHDATIPNPSAPSPFVCGGTITPTAASALVIGFGSVGEYFDVVLVPNSDLQEPVDDIPRASSPDAPHLFVGTKVVVTPTPTTIGGVVSGAGGGTGSAGVTLVVLPDVSGAPPDPAQWTPWTVVDMSENGGVSVGTTAFPYADRSLQVKVDGVLISTASYVETDGSCGDFALTWLLDPDEVVTVSYQGR